MTGGPWNALICPICGHPSAEPVLKKFTTTVRADRQSPPSKGGVLAAYRCRENGHVFWVREGDMPPRDTQANALVTKTGT
jgi:hypothetical protein